MRRPRNSEDTTVLPAQPMAGGPSQPSFSGGAPAGTLAAPVQREPEEVVARVRRHGRHLAPAVILMFALAAAGGFFIGALPEPWMNFAAAGGAILLLIFGGLGPLFGWLARRTVITTRRVIVHRGFFVRHRTELSLARVREVRSKQNPIQRMWGSGDIDLYVGAEATRISDAPGAQQLHAALQELSERSYDEQFRASGFGL